MKSLFPQADGKTSRQEPLSLFELCKNLIKTGSELYIASLKLLPTDTVTSCHKPVFKSTVEWVLHKHCLRPFSSGCCTSIWWHTAMSHPHDNVHGLKCAHVYTPHDTDTVSGAACVRCSHWTPVIPDFCYENCCATVTALLPERRELKKSWCVSG